MVSINSGLLTSKTTELTVINNPYSNGAAKMYEDGLFVTVDVEFLADSHICVYEDPSSYGRYLCFDRVVSRPDDAVVLATHPLTTISSPYPPPVNSNGSVTEYLLLKLQVVRLKKYL